MYSFKIDIGSFDTPVIGNGYITCDPFINGSRIKKYRHEDYFKVVRISIDGSLKFIDDPKSYKHGRNEYTALKTLDSEGELYVPIKCYYNDNLKLTGRLNLRGSFDENKHECLLDIQTEDSYSDLFTKIETEIDIKGASSQSVKTNFPSIIIRQESVCTTLAANEMKVVMFGDDADLWVTSSSDSSDCSGVETRHIYKSSFVRFAADGYTYSSAVSGYLKATSVSEYVQTEYDRFRLLTDVINYGFDLFGGTLSVDIDTFSDYFNDIEPKLKYLLVSDKSDVKRKDNDAAGFELIAFNELLELYKTISNQDWYIDGGELKLEFPGTFQYPSFTTYPKHDFTVDENFVNLQRFGYDVKDRVNKESWKFEDTKNSDFKQQDIFYDNLEESTSDYNKGMFNMDFEYITTNPDDITDSGLALVACSKSGNQYYIYNGTGLLSPITLVNGKLATTNLINDHQLEANRPYGKGTFLSTEETLGQKPLKKVEYNNVPIFDVDDIDFDYGIKTELGLVIPTEINIDLELLTFSTFSGLAGQNAKPIVTTDEITLITDTTARGGGCVVNDNDRAVTERGVVYSLTEKPTTGDNKVISGSGLGTFNADMTGLTETTVYYIRAYAINSEGTSYGNQVSFATTGDPPTVTTDEITDLTPITATVNSTVVSVGGSALTQRGVCYIQGTGTPLIINFTETSIGQDGEYSVELEDLTPETTYSCRAFATNASGTSYGSKITFTTGDIEDLWTVLLTSPAIDDEDVTITSRTVTLVDIILRFGIYINGSWEYDTENVSETAIATIDNFLVSNTLGTPIPSGTRWKFEVIYDSNEYGVTSGTL